MLVPESKIYVAGHRGLVGSALMRVLEKQGFTNLLSRSHRELDLCDGPSTRTFFEEEKPEFVFLAAAKVGGIVANSSLPAEFIHQNLSIQSNVIHEAWRVGTERLIFLGSSCIYPRDCPQPIKEEYLLTGPLEHTNRAYAIAKIAGVEMCRAYNEQYGTQFLAVMPTNLFGPGDNYDLKTSHVLPALIRRFHEAREDAAPSVTLWGSGVPKREFLISEEMAEACLFLMQQDSAVWKALLQKHERPPLVNIGVGKDMSIAELAKLVAGVVGYEGEILWDRSKPDGTPRKLLDVQRLTNLGWKAKMGLREGVGVAYEDFLSRRNPRVR